MNKEKILVTSALPYANGPIHIGHIAGAYLPADIFVKYNKMKGNDIIYICGSDEHGVPITLRAKQDGVEPQKIVDYYHLNMLNSFKKLNINFDNFSGTARPIHHELSKEFFLRLKENGYISEKTVKQFYCEHDKMFLPDRFLEGVCPNCSFEQARGDECPKCGKWIEPEKLINPKCKNCNNSPILKNTKHWFLGLDKFQDKIKQWLNNKHNLKSNVKKFALSWIKEGLNERAITRDIDWGVKVPLNNADGKVLYVWFDAPIGYISSTIEWSKNINNPDKWKDYWLNPDCKIVHFIGKDNIPFHIIVWTAILMGQKSNYTLPYDVPANEHLTIEGEKLSTSKGNVVWVDDYIKHFSSDSLRYYLAAMSPETKDSDFSWKNLQEKNNSELNNVLGNFINRTLTFIKKNFNSIIPPQSKLDNTDNHIINTIKTMPSIIGDALSNFKVREAIFHVIDYARMGNQYFDHQKPWNLIKIDKNRCSTVIHNCILIIKTISPLSYPFIPESSQKMWNMIGESGEVNKISWDSIKNLKIKENSKIGNIDLLFSKIDDKTIKKVLNEFHKQITKQTNNKNTISIDDFNKIDLKIGTVIRCEKLKGSKKLLKLQIKIDDNIQQVISGIANHYMPDELINKQVVVVNNLKKTKIMGEESNGMILCAGSDEQLTIISPVSYIKEGAKVS